MLDAVSIAAVTDFCTSAKNQQGFLCLGAMPLLKDCGDGTACAVQWHRWAADSFMFR